MFCVVRSLHTFGVRLVINGEGGGGRNMLRAFTKTVFYRIYRTLLAGFKRTVSKLSRRTAFSGVRGIRSPPLNAVFFSSLPF